MIKQIPETNQTIIEFGTGDINIIPGILKEEEIGIIALRNQKPRKIGLNNGDIPPNKLTEIPIILQFNKTESIDVLIYSLKETKEMMLHREEWINKDNTLID
jgi:hypothetical protein